MEDRTPLDRPFTTIAGQTTAELRDRGSRFVGYALPVERESEIAEAVDRFAAMHHAASHVCYGFRLRTGLARGHDDGEPSQSAGAPILQAIEGRDLHDVAAIVVRYFGGSKLGVGGLVRAYGGAAAMALDAAIPRRARPAVSVSIHYPYALTGAVMRSLEGVALSQRHGYTADGAHAHSEATVERKAADALIAELREATRGEVVAEIGSARIWYEPVAASG